MRLLRTASALALLALAASARPSGATVADDLPCTNGPATCTLDKHTDIPISPGSTLNFGTRDLIIKRQTRLVVGPSVGAMTILAKSVTLDPGASLVAGGGQITVTTTGDIRISAASGNFARIDVSANGGGGSMTLSAGGQTDLSGVLSAKAAAGDGGNIDVTATTRISLSGELNATGRGTGAGGTVSLKTTAGPISVDGLVDVSGTEGGGGDIDIEGSAGITTTEKLDVSGGGSGGSGGSITLMSSAGNIHMYAGLDGRGAPAGAIDFGGTGAVVEITAAQSVTIDGQIILSGGAPDGEGGSVEVQTDGDLIFNSSILAQGNGVDGCGSPDGINLTARGDITLNDIDVSGGTCGGGSIDMFAGGKISLAAPFHILAEGTGPLGFAGVVSMRAESLQMDGDVSAGSEAFIGGDVTLEACGDVTVSATSVVSAKGVAGTTALLARGTLRVAGRVFSGVLPLGSQGSNTIEYRTTPPNLTGSNILPPPTLSGNLDSCDPCGNMVVEGNEQCDDGNRIDDPVCDSNCTFPGCGNGIVDPGEACDDGNTASCDGCNANCTRPDNVCGDNTTECGEACDDGNTKDCNGDCKSDCSRHDDVCGDNIIECAEECDGQNLNGGLHCSQTCKLEAPPHCNDGNNTIETNEGEQCDPPTPGFCSHLCQLVICGDNSVEDGEACDDGNLDSCDGCSADCKQIDDICGDGHKDCSELCDDGNLVDGDGCDSNCTPTGCGNGIMTSREACDDGNTDNCDGCNSNCTRGDDVCGDRIVECSEDCEPPAARCDSQCHETAACATDADCGGICAGRCVAGVCSIAARLDCNDNNPCSSDACVNDACQHTPAANGTPCNDGNACTTESCQSGQCVASAATCDDGDSCTDDSCAPATGCAHVRRTGIGGVTCQLDAIDDAITRGAALLRGSARQRISNAVRKARTSLADANAAAGTPRAAKKLKVAKKALSALAKAVKMARKKHQITEPLGGIVDGFASGALGAINSVQI